MFRQLVKGVCITTGAVVLLPVVISVGMVGITGIGIAKEMLFTEKETTTEDGNNIVKYGDKIKITSNDNFYSFKYATKM